MITSLIKNFKQAYKQTRNPAFLRYLEAARLSAANKTPSRTEIINFLLSHNFKHKKTKYLEIGVRNPSDNFDHIKSDEKYSVDPGLEYKQNPVTFRITSDEFFSLLEDATSSIFGTKFDLIFIDGVHKAPQVARDITNAMKHIQPDGFVLLHDCNPPTEWHSRSDFHYKYTPAGPSWNGTTWKAFVAKRSDPNVSCCCINSDWGVGVISRHMNFGSHIKELDQFFDYDVFDQKRTEYLNLVSFERFKEFF